MGYNPLTDRGEPCTSIRRAQEATQNNAGGAVAMSTSRPTTSVVQQAQVECGFVRDLVALLPTAAEKPP